MAEPPSPFPCPCCGFPTLPSPLTSVCAICWWEVDGVDAPEDEVSGGPNHGYSLRRARANFRAHGHMYDVGREIGLLRDPSAERTSLMAYVSAVRDGRSAFDQARLERLIRQDRESWPRPAEPADADSEDEARLLTLLGLASRTGTGTG